MKRNGAPFLWSGCAVLAEYAASERLYENYKSGMYSYLLLAGKLDSYLADLNEQAQEWYELIESYYEEARVEKIS